MNTSSNWEQAAQLLKENRQLFDAFRNVCCELFQIQVEQKQQPFKRKPAIGLRFKAEADQLVVCCPQFDSDKKQVRCGDQLLEYYRPVQRLKVRLSQDVCYLQRAFKSRALQDVQQLLAAVKGFMEAPELQLQDMENCAICGRKLKDGQSRARGVGPECIEVVRTIPLFSNRSILSSEQPSQLKLPLSV
jgi:hypothetical protein